MMWKGRGRLQDINRLASGWAVRLDAGDLPDAERLRLERWLAADPRHRGALLRARAGLVLLGGDQQPTASVRYLVDRDSASAVAQQTAGRHLAWRWPAGLAAACAAAVAVWVAVPGGTHLDTRFGEVRRVALDDGSVALVNAHSNLVVDYEKAARQIRVSSGEAWFQVAHNAARPFVVTAGPIHVRATGTAFAVRRDKDGKVRVVVTEGTVEVWRDGQNRRLKVASGHQALLAAQEAPLPIKVQAIGTAHPLAWREGGIELDGMSVRDAVAEFNRYNARRIRLGDGAIGDIKMIGYFKLDSPEQFADAVANVTGSKVSHNENEIFIKM